MNKLLLSDLFNVVVLTDVEFTGEVFDRRAAGQAAL